MKDMLPAWLTPQEIESTLAKATEPDSAALSAILEKSLALQPLGLAEVAALLRVESKEGLRTVFEAADKVKQKVYGDRVVLTAPLHLSNHCGSECLYCANRKGNDMVQRKYMTSPEISEAGRKLIRQGHKRVFLVSGQLPNADVEYLAEAVSILYTLYEGDGEIRRVNVNVGPLAADQYDVLRAADVGSVLLYQDTYHPEHYQAVHKAGPKANYERRVNAADEALSAGMGDVGLGLLLGLAPWQFDVLALSLHAAHLASVYGTGGETADVGDLVRTIIVDSTVTCRMKRSDVIDNANIRPGDVIVGLASYGQATYEKEYNGGMGSNGLTSARHDVFAKYLAEKYPESYDHAVPQELVYSGALRLTDAVEGSPLDAGKLVLSPTRTYAPVVKRLLDALRPEIHGMVHCSGGAQTKVLHFVGDNCRVIKDNLFPVPPLFRTIKEQSGTEWDEMYKVFNMGHRLEVYLSPEHAEEVIAISKSFNIDAQVIGRIEEGERRELIIRSEFGEFRY